MLKRIFQISIVLILLSGLLAFKLAGTGEYSTYSNNSFFQNDDILSLSVEEALIKLDDDKPIQYIPAVDLDSARMGEELIKYGRLKNNSNSRLSKYFVCTDCHNLQLETDDPSDESPERVLAHSMKNNIPFLPASTFYGMYNKKTWYNGDYAKKYGSLVEPCRDTLLNAIQLCATQCSQGREMEEWELRAVLHYFKSIELKISDLKFSDQEITQISKALVANNKKAIKIIKSKYLPYNDAHFGTSEIPKIDGYKPDLKRGHYIFEFGCLHCHSAEKNITNFDMDMSSLTFKFLNNKKNKYNSYSTSHITRYGTYAISGRKQYMPQYSYENMSNEQMLDLFYFIETKATE
jgi:mono/diheme cytochrome c family protein